MENRGKLRFLPQARGQRRAKERDREEPKNIADSRGPRTSNRPQEVKASVIVSTHGKFCASEGQPMTTRAVHHDQDRRTEPRRGPTSKTAGLFRGIGVDHAQDCHIGMPKPVAGESYVPGVELVLHLPPTGAPALDVDRRERSRLITTPSLF